jgi:hypothetical protein
MRLPKLARFLGFSLIIAAAVLPASAAQPCSCDFCQHVSLSARCNFDGPTTCGAFLAAAICPAG